MISLIWAMDKNNLIGVDNDLPWHYSEDLKYFKEKTLGKTVLMGKNTFFSIFNRLNKPLPNRINIVASSNKEFVRDDVTVIHNLLDFLKDNQYTDEEIFVIGGKQIYTLSLPYAKRLYITHINEEYKGDVYFPKIDYTKYQIISKNTVGVLDFVIYERK